MPLSNAARRIGLAVAVLCSLAGCGHAPPPPPPSNMVELPLPTPANARSQWISLRADGPADLWAIRTGDRSELFRFDGAAWRGVPIEDGDTAMRAVFPVSPTDVWRVGANGRVAHFDGARWTVEQLALARVSEALPTSYFDLTDVVAWPGEAWVFDSGPNYYRFANGAWTKGSLDGLGAAHVSSPWGLAPDDVWASTGDGLVRYDGRAWRRVDLPGTVAGVVTLVTGSAANDVWLVTRERGAASERSRLYHFDGATWTETPADASAIVYDLAARSPREAYAVGRGTLLRWDGARWSSPENPGARTYDRVVVAGDATLFASGGTTYRYAP